MGYTLGYTIQCKQIIDIEEIKKLFPKAIFEVDEKEFLILTPKDKYLVASIPLDCKTSKSYYEQDLDVVSGNVLLTNIYIILLYFNCDIEMNEKVTSLDGTKEDLKNSLTNMVMCGHELNTLLMTEALIIYYGWDILD